jgi:hypothetical protein
MGNAEGNATQRRPGEQWPSRALPSTPVLPADFANKWLGSTRTERAASQEHFIDLCRMLGVPTPNEADPSGDYYAFEKGAEKTGGGDGFADVWRRDYFAWEYKGKRKDLNAAVGCNGGSDISRSS